MSDIHPENADRILLTDIKNMFYIKRLQFSIKFHQALLTPYPAITKTRVQRNFLQCSINLTLLTFFLLTLGYLIQPTLLFQARDTSLTICQAPKLLMLLQQMGCLTS